MSMENREWKNKKALPHILSSIPTAVLGRTTDHFTKENYSASLARYTDEIREIFDSLQACCDAAPEKEEEILRAACGALLDAVSDDLSSRDKYRRFNERALKLDTYKMVIVTYLTPAVYKMELGISEKFNEILHEEWLLRWPKQPYQTVTEEMISAGFDRKWYQCYITQAVCGYLGKPDDGYELTMFRNFRDTYLASCPAGPVLIREYYQTAPAIVSRMELSGQGSHIYPRLWETYLAPCLKDIELGNLSACKLRYVKMVKALQKEYLFME